MKNTISKLALLLFCLMSFEAMSQQIHSSYFMERAPLRGRMNPALMPDYGYLALPGIGNISATTMSNFGITDFLYPSKTNPNELVTFLNSQVDSKNFMRKLNSRSRLNANVDVNMLGFGFFDKKGGFTTFDMSIKANVGAYIPKGLFGFMKTLGDEVVNEFDISNLMVMANSYLETGVSHARPINDRLTVGAKLKVLVGLADVDASISTLKLRFDENAIYAKTQGKLHGSLPKGLGVTTGSDGMISGVDFDNMDFAKPIGGYGVGVDLGATYKLLDKLILSAAITDLGFITWNNTYNGVSPEAEYNFTGFDNVADNATIDNEIDDIKGTFEQLTKFNVNDKGHRVTSLNTTLNIGAEYKLFDQLSFGVLSSTHFDRGSVWSEGMLAINMRPAKCVGLTLTGSVGDYGVSWGGVLSIAPGGFTIFLATDYMVSKVTPGYDLGGFKVPIPIDNVNLNINFGLLFPLNKNPMLKRPHLEMID